MTALLPDATELADQLQHARATREHLDRVIAWIEQGIALLGAPAGERDHEPLPPPTPDDAAVPERALPPGNMRAEYSSSDSSASSEEAKPEQDASEPIVSRSEGRPQVPTTTTRRQNGGGASGAASDRTGMGPAGSAAGTTPAPRGGQRDRDAKVLATVLNANAPLSKQQIAERTGLTTSQVTSVLQRLVAAEKVRAEGATKSRRYRAGEHRPHTEHGKRTTAGRARSAAKITDAVARVGLRDRVMKAVSADPAALDNHRLALALNATLEDVADACQWLVSKDKVQMADDGTYLRSAAEAAREVAAA